MSNLKSINKENGELVIYKIDTSLPWNKQALWQRYNILYNGRSGIPLLYKGYGKGYYNIYFGYVPSDNNEMYFDLSKSAEIMDNLKAFSEDILELKDKLEKKKILE